MLSSLARLLIGVAVLIGSSSVPGVGAASSEATKVVVAVAEVRAPASSVVIAATTTSKLRIL